ncbi:hypothetical protein BGX26_009774 [Mortierella sp. AD094]|nr:hypothetical protein BGX26_009774 [Mortierella sp. AD094]
MKAMLQTEHDEMKVTLQREHDEMKTTLQRHHEEMKVTPQNNLDEMKFVVAQLLEEKRQAQVTKSACSRPYIYYADTTLDSSKYGALFVEFKKPEMNDDGLGGDKRKS